MHRRMLVVLERIGLAIGDGRDGDQRSLALVLSYFSEFVLGVHQVKETEYMFPAAAMMDFADAAESVGRLIADHDETSILLGSLSGLCRAGALGEEERDGFLKLVRTYSKRALRHMKEEEEIFVLAGEFLSDEDKALMLRQFAKVDRGQRGAKAWEREIKRLESLLP